MYGIRENLAPIIQSYFSIPLENRLRTTSPRQRQRGWLQLVQMATAHSSAQGSRQAIAPSYFPHVHPTGTRIPVTETTSACTPTLLVPSHQVSITSYLTSRVTSSSMRPYHSGMVHQKVGFDNYNHNWLYITQFMQFFVTYERCFLFTH